MNESDIVPAPKEGIPPSLHVYAAASITRRLEQMLSHLEGVRQGEELGPVHQMRVWSRRTRAALEVFESFFPAKEFTGITREVKAAADALGEARDLDVMIETLSERAEALPVVQRPGLEAFIQQLKAQRAARQRAVTKAIERLERQDLAPRFAHLSAQSSPDANPPVVHPVDPLHPAARKRASHG